MAYKLYQELAHWWPLLSLPEDYAEEAQFYYGLLHQAGLAAAPTLLELGCGGGNNAYHLKPHFSQLTLTDQSSAMLAVSQELNPDCEHVCGDMRKLDLQRQFDVVFIHDALDYMTTLEDLEQALITAFKHCKAGGLTLLVPDHTQENFQPATEQGGQDGNGRALRYLEWTHAAKGNTYTVDYVYLLQKAGQATQIEHEQHILGLFSRSEWLELLTKVGFQAQIIHDPWGRASFLAHKPLMRHTAEKIL